MDQNRFRKSTDNLTGENQTYATNTSPSVDVNDILSSILPEIQKQPKAKAVNYYLSNDVINAVEEISSTRNISKSKLVDTILRRVLLS